jgi:FkbM family methyltransferase
MGLKMLLFGTYESVEISTLCKHAKPGSMAIDVGANIGICTLEFSAAVGEEGMVLAIEPHPETAARLSENISKNRVNNVLVKEVCATDFEGTIDLVLSDDPTLHSTVNVPPDAIGASLTLPATRIDEMWGALGRPLVSVLKIDVEGAEYEVLSGSDMLLTDQHPSILLEASSPERLKKISDLLSKYGYAAEQPKGFESRDFLFIHKELARG